MKRFFKVFLCSVFFTSLFTMNYAFAFSATPDVAAEGMILIDAQTGTILAEKNPDKKLAPASTTKIMTALLTLENTKLTDVVTVGPNPPFADGSSIALKEGDKYTVEQLLHALLLESANDAALALAEHISGSETKFTTLMNTRAKELGAKNTNFVTSNGLYNENHYSTAYDLSLIMREAIKYPDYLRISKVISYELPASVVDNQTKWVNNTSNMINPNSQHYYKNLLASKTGYTELARSAFVASAQEDRQTLISVLLKCETKSDNLKDTRALFDYGFENYDLVKVFSKGDVVTNLELKKDTIPLLASDDIYYIEDARDHSKVKTADVASIHENIAPTVVIDDQNLDKKSLKKDNISLNADISINGKLIKSVPLISDSKSNDVVAKASDTSSNKNIIIIVSVIVSIIVILLIALSFIKKNKYNRRRKNIIFKNKKKNKLKW